MTSVVVPYSSVPQICLVVRLSISFLMVVDGASSPVNCTDVEHSQVPLTLIPSKDISRQSGADDVTCISIRRSEMKSVVSLHVMFCRTEC